MGPVVREAPDDSAAVAVERGDPFDQRQGAHVTTDGAVAASMGRRAEDDEAAPGTLVSAEAAKERCDRGIRLDGENRGSILVSPESGG